MGAPAGVNRFRPVGLGLGLAAHPHLLSTPGCGDPWGQHPVQIFSYLEADPLLVLAHSRKVGAVGLTRPHPEPYPWVGGGHQGRGRAWLELFGARW